MSLKQELLKRKDEFLPLWDELHMLLITEGRETNKSLIEGEMDNWIKINCAPDGTIDSLRNQEDIHEEVYQSIMPFL